MCAVWGIDAAHAQTMVYSLPFGRKAQSACAHVDLFGLWCGG
jgi:hypothetical protein